MSNKSDDPLSRVFQALSDPTRRKMLELLRDEELTLSQLAEPFAMTLPAVLKHLHVLSDAGLIEHYKSGRVRHCRREEGPIFDATVWLSKQSKYWQSQFETLAAFLSLQTDSTNKGEPNELRNKKGPTSAAAKSDERVTKKILETRKSQEPEKVNNYELTTKNGEKVKLLDLFGDKKELFVIHSMGRKCTYCTLWADGFNGVLPHLENRAAFVLSSPDSPAVQTEFAQSRGWKFRMVSTEGTSFAKDLGYQNEKGLQPGVSVFVKSGNDILRVSDDQFGPGDDYCQIWHLFDLLPTGAGDWAPKYIYG